MPAYEDDFCDMVPEIEETEVEAGDIYPDVTELDECELPFDVDPADLEIYGVEYEGMENEMPW